MTASDAQSDASRVPGIAYGRMLGLTGDPIVYRDEALPRSEYQRRPELYRMLNDAKAGAFPSRV